MNYPYRYPASMLLARLGFTITIDVSFFYDDEAKVFIATSKDIRGLVLENDNFNILKKEVEEAIPALLELNHSQALPEHKTDIILTDHIIA